MEYDKPPPRPRPSARTLQMAVLAVLVLFETRREYLVEMDQLMHRVDDK